MLKLFKGDFIDFHKKPVPEDKIRCPYVDCVAGRGVAGMGACFRDGNPRRKHCRKWKSDAEADKDYEDEDGEGQQIIDREIANY